MTETGLRVTLASVVDDAIIPVLMPPATLRVLHVEDNLADALLTQEYIRDALPEVEFDSAVRIAEITGDRVAVADCAILDLSLPDASGLEALLALRRMSERLPIVVLTGLDDLEIGVAAVREGADDYLIKNHIDGYTLERSLKYSIERRLLMFDMVSTAAEVTAAPSLVRGEPAEPVNAVIAALVPQEDGAVMTERFHQLGQISEVLGISPSQTYALVRSGELRAIKVGGRGQWRVATSVLNNYIDRMYTETQDFVKNHPYTTFGK